MNHGPWFGKRLEVNNVKDLLDNRSKPSIPLIPFPFIDSDSECRSSSDSTLGSSDLGL